MASVLASMLDEAAHGRFPAPDGACDVVGPPRGRCDAVVAFTGHFVVAADVTETEVTSALPAQLGAPMSTAFLAWLASRLATVAGSHDVLLSAIAHGGGSAGLDPIDLEDAAAHPRVARAARYRDELRAWNSSTGVVVLGRGLARRWEIAFEVGARRDAGAGRAIVAAGLSLLPEGTPVFAQVAPGNAASLRAVLAAGFVPIGAEVLFPRS